MLFACRIIFNPVCPASGNKDIEKQAKPLGDSFTGT